MTDFAHIQSSMYDTCLYCSHGLNTWPMNLLICMCTYITYVVKLQYIAAGITYMGTVPDHDGGWPIEVNACILITQMVYL
jgi:hypothetical protein